MILFNENQRKCIEHPPAPLMIIAGAGTGKTTTLIARIAYFINERNIDPHRIVCVFCLMYLILLFDERNCFIIPTLYLLFCTYCFVFIGIQCLLFTHCVYLLLGVFCSSY